MVVIGITGGIAAGKTRVAEAISEIVKTEFINTDLIAKEQMNNEISVQNEVINYFGSKILDTFGKIDRSKLAEIVFSDEEKLKILNNITHPYVTKYVETKLNLLKTEGNVDVVLIETALLSEVGYEKYCDEVWYIHCPIDERKDRMRKNRGYDDSKISDILKRQMSDDEYKYNSTRIIENGNNISYENLKKHLNSILKALL